MFSKELTLADHSRRFTVTSSSTGGWELEVTADHDVVRRACYSDWHRLERAMNAMEREVSKLIAQGWRVSASVVDDVYSTNR